MRQRSARFTRREVLQERVAMVQQRSHLDYQLGAENDRSRQLEPPFPPPRAADECPLSEEDRKTFARFQYFGF